MTKSTSSGSHKKTNIGKLFTGVSGVALLLGVANGSARAAGITIQSSVTASVFVTTGSTVDFIDITTGGIVTNNVQNEGTIGLTDVGIEVHNGGFVGGGITNLSKGTITASKTGIAVRSDTPGQNIVGGGILNLGVINAVNLSAKSTALIGINVTGSGILTSLTNAGTLNVTQTGSGTGTHPAIGINVVSSGIINANVSNSGEIDIEAFWGTGVASQDAQATAVNVSNTSPADSANISFTNSGQIFVDATAQDLIIGLGNADAEALGVGLAGIGNASATTVNVSLLNTSKGWISAEASARGSGTFTANVNANATGAQLTATGGVNINVDLTNNGLIHASASANAFTGSGSGAQARATAIGTQQVGIATKATVFNELGGFNNSNGLIEVTAKADASGSTATATATALGAPQFANGGDSIDIEYNNSGVIDVQAGANASNGDLANANAFGVGVDQSAVATGSTTKVFVSFFNDTKAEIDVKATAVATKAGTANAQATATGVRQSGKGGTLSQIVMDNDGDIFAFAGAIATKATNANATASAFGTRQLAVATKNTIFNSLTANNTNDIGAFAFAIATKAEDAEANAFAMGAPQSAIGGTTIDVAYDNSGDILGIAFAKITKVVDGSGNAEAIGAGQLAVATKNTITNSVTMMNMSGTIDGSAKAIVRAGSSAKASATGVGMVQEVVGGASATAFLTNTGDISGRAIAVADDTKGGSGVTFASASAFAVGAVQEVGGATSLSATMLNSGTINANALALAGVTEGAGATVASAKATAIGTLQAAFGGASTTSVSLNATNSGLVNAKATAEANAVGSGVAHATANAAGAPQFAFGGQTITINLNNTGFLGAVANGTATGGMTAIAFASASGAGQLAVATTLTNSVTLNIFNTTSGTISGGTATGTISAFASANAGFAFFASANARAVGATQSVSDSGGFFGSAFVTFSNSGLVDVEARALALPAGLARANASAVGTQQFARVIPGLNNSLIAINNAGGVYDVDAFAHASATASAIANATAIGAPQTAVGGSLIMVDLNNSGLIDIDATALATGPTANANAFALGARQSGSGSTGTISNIVNLVNTTSGIIHASAVASASGSSANARATATGVYQRGVSGTSILISGSNNSLIEVDAFADATGPNGDATAFAAGVVQSGTGSAFTTFNGISFNNSVSGVIDVSATANVVGASADARFTAVGLAQFVTGGTSAAASVVNNGLIDVDGFGFATGFAVTVIGSAIGVNQVGSATGSTTSLSLNVTNTTSGIIDVDAGASYGWSTFLSTSVGAIGVGQAVLGGGSVTMGVDNDGSIDARGVAYGIGVRQAGLYTTTAAVDLDVFNNTSATIGAHATIIQTGSMVAPSNAATGILQTGTGMGSLTANVLNAGFLDVEANATAAGFGVTADAEAAGIYQIVSGGAGTTSVALGVTNFATVIASTTKTPGTTITGVINVVASANASGVSQQASATASGAVNQLIHNMTAGSTASTLFINQGTVDVSALASATGDEPDAFAFAWGVWQFIGDAADTASGTFTNATSASFDVLAVAFAGETPSSGSGTAASATASLVGVFQTIRGGQTVSALVQNDGSFNVRANASATGNSPFARAGVDIGIFQSARATGGAGSTATATINNTSFLSLNLDATAMATGSTFAQASASIITGIFQTIDDGETTSVTLNNSGAITMDANAFAFNTDVGNATADASIQTGIYQFASAPGGDQLSASVDLINSGLISMNVFASATAPGQANARATITTGIYQSATSADSASVTLTNTVTGTIELTGFAYGSATKVRVDVDNTHIVDQSANAGDDNVSASATVDNAGLISVDLFGWAFGTDGSSSPGTDVSASAFLSYAFTLNASDGALSTVTLDNSGSILIDVVMIASHASDAFASVDFDTVFYMTANGNGGLDDTATVNFTNSGMISVDLDAFASGTTDADATIDLGYFWEGSARDASNASYNITNSSTGIIVGIIDVDMNATAIATNGNADAEASLENYIATIDATASSGTNQDSASITFTNEGIITFDLVANATAFGIGTTNDDADALAYINSGFVFSANNGDDTTITFTNSATGSITINLTANALANDPDATASFDNTIIYQSANAGGDKDTATATINNAGSFIVDVFASAVGTNGASGVGTSQAFAFATIDYGISQNAEDAAAATVSLTNDGTMSFLVGALATHASSAFASANIGSAIQQSASATSGIGSTATVTLTNTSLLSLNFEVTAQAYGVTYAFASAEIDDTVIEQNADHAETASVSINNSGLINFLAQATASASDGSATARASIDYGISQSASASGGDNLLASVSLTNSGVINFVAIANASAFGTTISSDTAFAFATVDSAFFQDADDGDVLTITLNNSGDINVIAMANALGGDASATASIGSDVFDQEANNTSSSDRISATVDITNSGNITVLAQAVAIGTDGASGSGNTIDAFASVSTFVSQSARDAISLSVTFNNTSNGDIDVSAIAIASNGSDASASASIGYAIYQTAIGHATGVVSLTANVTLDNDGTIDFVLMARATGTNTGDAYVEFDDSIIYQSADGVITATALIDNSGVFSVWGQASASAPSGDASATVVFDDALIQQYAFADITGGLSASGTINNSGVLSLVGIAHANGATSATASASLTHYGIYQSATVQSGTGTASRTASIALNNTSTGTINFQLMAEATGTNVYAQAEITKAGIYQSADANGGTSATALIDNDGTISFLAQATAFGTDGASGPGNTATAYASIDDGITQYAFSAVTGSATINNDGHLSFSALANAFNAISAQATAFMARVVSQTAQGTAAGSTGTATITNTSLTSFDVNIIAHATGVTSAMADASLSKTFIFQSAENAEVAVATIDNSGAINVNVLAQATALGNGNSGFAIASAFISNGVYQSANADRGDRVSADVSFNNSGTISFLLSAVAVGTTTVTASANFSKTVFFQSAFNGDDVSTTFTNSGDIDVISFAHASGGDDVRAVAYQNQASNPNSIHQQATAGSDENSATATFTNAAGGDILLMAIASAIGSVSATDAFASGAIFQVIVEQHADNALDSTVTFDNNGSLDAIGMALASNAGVANAIVEMESGIVFQSANGFSGTAANGGSSLVTLNNTSILSLNYEGYAVALGGTTVRASVNFEQSYIFQWAGNNETASVSLNNSGSMALIGHATASAVGGNAIATAHLNAGIFQSASADDGAGLSATVSLTNSGTIFMDLQASAVGTTLASAFAFLTSAIRQQAFDGATISVSLNNSGSLTYQAIANAVGGTYAQATATATKVWQTVDASTSGVSQTLTFTNSNTGSFLASASASAVNTGDVTAIANAYAGGVSQFNQDPATQPVTFNNFSSLGNFTVSAFANASAATIANASATALGYIVQAGGANATPILNVSNGGSFQVNATAIGLVATATALGMVFSGGSLAGSISNSGTMNITASASGSTANALAIGIQFNAPVNNTTFTNTGTINVLAIGSTTATAIQYNTKTGQTQTATASDLAVFINNGGSLIAGENDGTLDFGTVINTTNAPHPVLINLQGSSQQGNIWGNALISGDDNILVSNGNTIWRGFINTSAGHTGSMTISAGGTLTMPTTGTGPFVGFVGNYSQTSSGTLAVNIFPSTGTNSLGQINALTASLAGTIQANVVAGLYANSQTYQDVVVASTLSGTWSSLTINTNTPLLSLSAVYPGDDTADLGLTRNAFNSVAGLTLNQTAAASGIESVYSTGLSGGFGAMVGEMFTFGTSTYISALEQLHGADYAQNQTANLGSMGLLNYSIEDRLNAGPIASNNRANTTIIQRGDMAVWARAQVVWGDADGDIEAPGYEQTQKAFYAGLDYAVGDDILIGFVAGYYDNEMRFNNGNRKDDDGVQLGLYAEYDTQKFYVRGIGGYASYNADSVRNISFGSTIGTNFGRYDSKVTSFMVETGRRFEIGQDFYFTPYGGLQYAKTKSDAFTETGLAASALAASANSAKSFMSDLGGRFTGAWDAGNGNKVIVEFGGAWQHEFKDDVVRWTTSYASAPGSTFTVIGSAIDAETFMLNASISLATKGGFEITASYWGRFNSNFKEHSAGFKVLKRF